MGHEQNRLTRLPPDADELVLEALASGSVTMTAVALSLGKLGNVKTQTLRAFTAEEMDKIIGKMV